MLSRAPGAVVSGLRPCMARDQFHAQTDRKAQMPSAITAMVVAMIVTVAAPVSARPGSRRRSRGNAKDALGRRHGLPCHRRIPERGGCAHPEVRGKRSRSVVPGGAGGGPFSGGVGFNVLSARSEQMRKPRRWRGFLRAFPIKVGLLPVRSCFPSFHCRSRGYHHQHGRPGGYFLMGDLHCYHGVGSQSDGFAAHVMQRSLAGFF